MRDALDSPARLNQPPAPAPGTHVVVTSVDLAMGAIALVLAVGLVAAVLLGRELPIVLVAFFGQIVTYYFGRQART